MAKLLIVVDLLEEEAPEELDWKTVGSLVKQGFQLGRISATVTDDAGEIIRESE